MYLSLKAAFHTRHSAMNIENRIFILRTDKLIPFFKDLFLGVVLHQQVTVITELERWDDIRGSCCPMVGQQITSTSNTMFE